MKQGWTMAWPGVVLLVLLAASPTSECLGAVEEPPPAAEVFQDEPVAEALYRTMIETMRRAETLSYRGRHWWDGDEENPSTYTVWLKKPNYFRVEVAAAEGATRATLVGDGETMWLFWSGERRRFWVETDEGYEKTKRNVYIKAAAPLARHSIGHKVVILGTWMIVDPSTFHGYTDSLQPYLDGVKGMGTEKVGDEECDVIEVSFMKHQRSWYLWLSQKDHLPRKIKQIVRVSHDSIMHERWSDIVIDANIPDDRFVWTPPEGWTQWEMPRGKDLLLKPGAEAPDFELASATGTKIKLSDYRGKIVWLYIWRAG
ncbi:MAG: DUF2092 domain-containing protein [Sedimentisphaerales bacterium]|nr:DUF2092 domain-containing protein [Sedimentisphaerales bacterium]